MGTTESDVLALARKLGAEIQSSGVYAEYAAAKAVNDGDELLQQRIGEFNLTRLSLDKALADDVRDNEKVRDLNRRMREEYSEIMAMPVMAAYSSAKVKLDALVNDVTSIITLCAGGADPVTCEPSRCTGSCETCAGCEQ